MAETPFWSYPGTWIGIVVTLVLVAGGIAMAVVLRRLLRQPPAPPQSTTSIAPEKNTRSHE